MYLFNRINTTASSSLCHSPPPMSRPAASTAPPPSRPPAVRGPTPGPPPPLNPTSVFGAPPVPSRPGPPSAYAGDPSSTAVPLIPSRPARVPPALPPGIPRYNFIHAQFSFLYGFGVEKLKLTSHHVEFGSFLCSWRGYFLFLHQNAAH